MILPMKSRHLQPLTQKLSSKYTIISPRLWQKSYLDNCSISFDIASHSPPASADMLLKWYQRPLMRREDVILAWLQAWQSHVSINGWFHHGFRWLKFLCRFSSHRTNSFVCWMNILLSFWMKQKHRLRSYKMQFNSCNVPSLFPSNLLSLQIIISRRKGVGVGHAPLPRHLANAVPGRNEGKF